MERINTIKKRLNNILPGIWTYRWKPKDINNNFGRYRIFEKTSYSENENENVVFWCYGDIYVGREEGSKYYADFVANAPSDINYLLSELEKRSNISCELFDKIKELEEENHLLKIKIDKLDNKFKDLFKELI
jgi:hypothetical protein